MNLITYSWNKSEASKTKVKTQPKKEEMIGSSYTNKILLYVLVGRLALITFSINIVLSQYSQVPRSPSPQVPAVFCLNLFHTRPLSLYDFVIIQRKTVIIVYFDNIFTLKWQNTILSESNKHLTMNVFIYRISYAATVIAKILPKKGHPMSG